MNQSEDTTQTVVIRNVSEVGLVIAGTTDSTFDPNRGMISVRMVRRDVI